ncbi:glycoside hydrolase family 72 protein [Mycena epipterygia]|nr:glycoside hydrolase family 72 protein [Mycena epipterygia]
MVPLFATTALLALATTAGAISKVTRTGRYLYTDDGTRFFIKGVAYQPQGNVVASSSNAFNEPSTFIDPLADSNGCTRDLPFLQKLGVNTIRAYSVDSSLNHDSCMATFSGAGIYVIIDLALPLNGSISRDGPTWTTSLQDQYLVTINAFAKYDNVLAYNVGNEVMVLASTDPAPFVKAAARDIKAYLTSISSSALVGYAAIDGPADFLDPVANYLSCDPIGSNSGSSAIDLFGLNNYEWCGDVPPSTYDGTNAEFAGYNVAAYFSEFGSETCNPGVRVWTETGTLFSSPMTDIWSGGLAFSYFPASSSAGQFGMVNISSDGTTVTPNQDFNNLVTQYGAITFVNSPSQSSAMASSFPACPTANSSWAASNTLPPTPNEAACLCLDNALSCQFQPSTSNYSAIAGSLIDTACGLLGSSGGSCADIGGNGTTGVYGLVDMCDPITKVSYVFSQYFELQGREASACSFDGNGTVNAAASATASAAGTSCIASPSAVFTPTFSAGAVAGASSGSSSAKSGSNGAVSLLGGNALFSMAVMAGCMVAGALWTLA